MDSIDELEITKEFEFDFNDYIFDDIDEDDNEIMMDLENVQENELEAEEKEVNDDGE